MFSTFKKIWNERGFEILLGLSVAFLIIFTLYHKLTGTKGTYSRKHPTGLTPTRKPSGIPKRRLPPPLVKVKGRVNVGESYNTCSKNRFPPSALISYVTL